MRGHSRCPSLAGSGRDPGVTREESGQLDPIPGCLRFSKSALNKRGLGPLCMRTGPGLPEKLQIA